MDENKVITIDEASKRMKAVAEFANACYWKGANDAMKGVLVGALVVTMASVAAIVRVVIEEKKSKKTETEI